MINSNNCTSHKEKIASIMTDVADYVFAAEAYQEYARCQINMQGNGWKFTKEIVPSDFPYEKEDFSPSEDLKTNLEKAKSFISKAIDRIDAA
ncbi:hypothetical protein LMG33818_002493 [Halomonadaceae bacterium LMG 33818]|uniref:hypothetical protein n=1 Tax=Cernens ardua TaxID=3402176 RepID=UPI003EDBF11A